MIYTVTFNPSLDLKINLKSFNPNDLNRYENEIIIPGGKGINVSLMLKKLGQKSIVLGFYGGFIGNQMLEVLNKDVPTSFVKVVDNTRINIKVKSKTEMEFNGKGPFISDSKFEKLEIKIKKLKSNDILVISGSIPNGQKDAYKKIAKIAQERKILLIVDTNNESLKSVLQFKPFIIKPNKKEAEELFGKKLTSQQNIITIMKKFQKLGAQNILLSTGAQGAYLLTSNYKIFMIKAPVGKVINTVGSGDAMLAGFIYEFIKTNNYQKAFKKSVATGSASAFTENLANKKEIKIIEKTLIVKEINV